MWNALSVGLKEEESNETEFEEVESCEELIDGLGKDETVCFSLCIADIDHLVTIGKPKETERDDHHYQDQWGHNRVDDS